MATFPAIEPDARSHTLPGLPSSSFDSVMGVQIVFQNGLRAVDGILRIEFLNVTLSVCQQIIDHYLGQQQHLPFVVPPVIWGGYESEFTVNPWDVLYTYATPPQKQITAGGLWNVSVELATTLQPWA
jgi:hypothetical protein